LKLDTRDIGHSQGNPPRFKAEDKNTPARLASRVAITRHAHLRQSGSQEQFPVVVKDISVGGARIATHVRLRPNQCVTLTVDLGAAQRLDLPARVVHLGESGKEYRCNFGLRFAALPDEVSRSLSEFVFGQLRTRAGANFRKAGRP
jgi:c-di-GMP-binding flagellar brake protein YcgR